MIIWLGLWELIHYLTPEAQQKFLPGPGQVIAKIFTLIAEKEFLGDIGKSLYRIYVSFAVACLVAIPLGLLMAHSLRLRLLLTQLLEAGDIFLLPLLSPFFSFILDPMEQKKFDPWQFVGFFLIALILTWMLFSTQRISRVCATMGADRIHIVCKVIFPAAAPKILDSMRNMIAVSWTYLVIAEIVAATDGIGAVMMRASRFLHVDVIMAGILTIGILGVITDIISDGWAHHLFPHNRIGQ